MIFALLKKAWVFLGICFLLTACLKQNEWENLYLDPPSPHLAFPLLYETVTSNELIDLVSDSTRIIVNGQGVYAALFDASSIERTKNDLFPKTRFSFPIPIVDSVGLIPVPSLEQANPTIALLKGDQLRFILNSEEEEDIVVQMMIPQMSKDGKVFTREYVIPYKEDGMSSLTTPQINLEGFLLDFSQGVFNLKYDARKEDGTRIILPTSFAQIDALDFFFVQGQIYRTVVETGLETIEVDVQDTIVEGNYQFTNPRIHFDFINSFGFPIGVKVKEASIVNTTGEITPLTSYLFDDLVYLDYPASDRIGEVATNRLTIDRGNSNLAEISQSDISSIRYDLDIVANPNRDKSDQFFLTDTSYARMDAQLELSFEALIESISLQRSIDVMLEELDSISSLRLKLLVNNGIPLSFQPQLVLTRLDSSLMVELKAEAERAIEPASVDQNGMVSEVRESVIYFSLDAEQLSLLSEMDLLQLDLKVTSPGDGQSVAIISPSQALTVAIGAEVSLQ